MRETEMRRRLIRILEPIWARPVENMLDVGMPDVVCVAGWLELKVADRPKRPTTPVRVQWQPGQQPWLKRWRQHGGRAWTMLLLGEMWLLHDALWSVDRLGEATEDELIKHALGCWPKAPKFNELMEKLMGTKAVN